ncbi:hypothetical protein ATE47_04250 [Chryseobacterium sp. IHB B 17019]|uniref:hypothetical protein n=1 Tax=Chryseobacterium sp. IHB B 17019 TaxID=1721091 RepID=UPI0007225630|nr:hypothetical protein [Chryseobacterium sp. IHB B 17019]ALR29781.1 hypothetical protein ATE47_04250 [Chryseobacterium sp. IHB B 17019]
MELSGTVLKVFDETQVGKFKERIIRIVSVDRFQILDVYTYKNLAFRCGFLKKHEDVTFSILLTGTPEGEKQETKIIARKILKPTLELTKESSFY